MDVWRLLIAALRRWYVLLPLLALTGAAAFYAGQQVNPDYQTSGSILLVQPTTIPTEGTVVVNNPYNDLAQAGQVLQLIVSSSASRVALAEAGFDGAYEVGVVTRSAIMTIDVTASSPGSAVDTAQAVLGLIEDTLRDEQELLGVPVTQQSTVRVLDDPDSVGEVATARQRTMLAVAGVGAAISFVIAVLFDDLLLLLRRRRAGRREQAVANAGTTEGRGSRSEGRRKRRGADSADKTPGAEEHSDDSSRDAASDEPLELVER